LPFRIIVDPYAFAKFTEGALYNAHGVGYSLLSQTEDKLFMHQVFQRNNLLTPRLYAYSKTNKKVVYLHKIDDKETYIVKPRFGCLGNGILKVRGKYIKSFLQKRPNYLVQKFLKDCTNSNFARHYRINTLYDGTVIKVIQLSQRNAERIASNFIQGSNITYEPVPKEIKNLIKKVSKFHKIHLSNVLSVGWDLMLHCDTYVKHAYVLELNIGHGAVHEESSKDDIAHYISHAEKFHGLQTSAVNQ
jgi:glutathione synthase/RimK-type ligase-like ATP-grasp enzyme